MNGCRGMGCDGERQWDDAYVVSVSSVVDTLSSHLSNSGSALPSGGARRRERSCNNNTASYRNPLTQTSTQRLLSENTYSAARVRFGVFGQKDIYLNGGDLCRYPITHAILNLRMALIQI